MKTVHFILQGKGGVGKSVVASLLAQYLQYRDREVLCIDTDPVNQTFAAYSALDVHKILLLEDDEINERNFDVLTSKILDSGSKDVIIDNGASSFVVLSNYLISNEIASVLEDMDMKMVIHTVVTGGQALLDTLSGFSSLVKYFPETNNKFVVWLNPYWGIIEHEGRKFMQMNMYELYKHRILGVVNLPTLKANTFGRDFGDMLQARQTFEQGIKDLTLPFIMRNRLSITRRNLFRAIADAKIIEEDQD